MNENIIVMIELQKFWDVILSNKVEIDRCKKSIIFWENDLTEKKQEFQNIGEITKKLKSTIKENEVELSEFEDKCKKIESRKELLKSVKELDAQNIELEKVKSECNIKEEKLIFLMDELDENEKKLTLLNQELTEKKIQVESDIISLNSKINGFNSLILENQEKYEKKLSDLSQVYKSKFVKLLNSKTGKAVGEVNGEICSNCNFQIPSFLASESTDRTKVTTCSNCGRFIYKIIR